MDSRCKLVLFFIWFHLIPKSWILFPAVCDSILRLRPALCSVWWRCYCLRLALCLLMWNRVDPSSHEMVPRYKHAIKHEMRLVLLAKLLLSELRVLITDASLQCPGQPGGLRRVRTIRTWWRNFLRDTPMGIQMQRTADWPFEQSSLSTVWRVQVWKGWNAFTLANPAQTLKSQELSHDFISFSMRISMSPHFWWWTLNGIQQPHLLCSQQHPVTIVVLLLYVSYHCLALVNDCQKMPKAGASLSMTLAVGRGNFKIRDCTRKSLITGGDPAAPARKCMKAQSVWEFWWFTGPWLKHV